MSDRQRLKDLWRPVASAIRPDDELRHLRAVQVAVNGDGTIPTEAVIQAFPWQRIDFRLPGAVTTGSSLGGIYDFPQGARIHRISAHARVGPSSGPFTGRLAVNGVVEDSGSIQPGETTFATGASITVPPGGIVTLNVTSAGDAEDVTVSVFYSGGTA